MARPAKGPRDLLYLNGRHGRTGRPLIAPLPLADLAQRIRQREPSALAMPLEVVERGPYDDLSLDDPARVGWGVIAHVEEAPALREWLAPLIAHRRGQFFTYQGEPARVWKELHHADQRDTSTFPHYVLIAGAPGRVPFDLQFSLATRHAVGRITFDTAEEYACYVRTVLEHEIGTRPAPDRRAVFFATRDDPATESIHDNLVMPLFGDLPALFHGAAFEPLMAGDATKPKLFSALARGASPALLFTGSHGAALPADDPEQRDLQGSLVCQDADGGVGLEPTSGYISPHDVAEGFTLPGGVHLVFACYGAGTRRRSEFTRYLLDGEDRTTLNTCQGPEDFVAELPKALLAHATRGALAVIGHVDPAWTFFRSDLDDGLRIQPFGLAIARLLRGLPVGFAASDFAFRYADIAADLLNCIEPDTGDASTAYELAWLWIRRNDAKNFIVIGDPAVRLPPFAPPRQSL